jgi:hypothetical protein
MSNSTVRTVGTTFNEESPEEEREAHRDKMHWEAYWLVHSFKGRVCSETGGRVPRLQAGSALAPCAAICLGANRFLSSEQAFPHSRGDRKQMEFNRGQYNCADFLKKLAIGQLLEQGVSLTEILEQIRMIEYL